jgi:alcohol dehydrogenase
MKMTAAVLYEQGLPHPFTVSKPMRIEQVTLTPPAPGEVLIQVAAAGLCHSDLSAIEGVRQRKLPTVVGHEGAGVVVELGAGVHDVKVGDHVVTSFVSSCGNCRYCSDARPHLCTVSTASRANGTLPSGTRHLACDDGRELNHYSGLSVYAQYATIDQSAVVPIDRRVPLPVASLFGCAVMTGVGAVVNTAKVAPGRSAAVVGLGGVGLNSLLGLVASGAFPIIAADVLPAKLELAKSLGATHTVLANAKDAITQVRDLTRGGVDFAFEMAGSMPAMEFAYAITARGGTTVSAGLPRPDAAIAYPHAAMVSDERTIRGSYMGSCIARRDIPRFIDLFMAGKLPVDKLHAGDLGFDGLNEGFDKLADGSVVRQTLRPNLQAA